MTLYQASTDDQCVGHVFDYGAHNATVDNPYGCIVEGCIAVLVPVVPVDTNPMEKEQP